MADFDLQHVIVVNESSRESAAGDVELFRNTESACGYLEHWWVEDGEGFALTGVGHRVVLGVDARKRVIVERIEPRENGPALLTAWLKSAAQSVLEARQFKARKRRAVLTDMEMRGETPATIEELIAEYKARLDK